MKATGEALNADAIVCRSDGPELLNYAKSASPLGTR